MTDFDIETIRAEVRAMDFVRGTPADIAEWRMAHEDSRHNLVIEDMIPTPNEDAFFALMLEEGVSPELTTQIVVRLLDAEMLARHLVRHGHDAQGHAVMGFNVEAVRARVRALDFVRATPEQVAGWRIADGDSRTTLVSKGMMVEPVDDRLFAMFMDEAVPLDVCATIVRNLLDHPDAEPALPIAPMIAMDEESR